MEIGDKQKFIDVQQVIRKKNPKLAKWIPKPFLRFLSRTIHQEEINRIMLDYHDKMGLDFVDAVIQDLGVHVVLEGQENLPNDKGVVFASNHPLGGLDGIAFMHAIGRHRRDVKFLVNDILMNIRNLEPLFVPINKHGGQAKGYIKAINEAYAADQALLVFPAGLVSREIKGEITDLEWKKSFISRSKKYQKNIVPVYIEGKNSKFFYKFAKLRQRLGVKINLEMLFLPKEMFAQKNQTVKIIIGKEIPYTTFSKEHNEQYWENEVRQQVYALGGK